MACIKWTRTARDWLKKIHDYIAIDKPDAAKKLIRAIMNRVTLLEQFPEQGQRLTGFHNKDIRALLYGHYRVIYQIKKNKNIIILGVFHGSLDLKKHLKK